MKEQTLTRRGFTKLMAASGAAAAMGTAMANSFSKVEPAAADDEETSSSRTIYTATCHGCIQTCPVRVYVENDVVTKIEGHPLSPTSMGSVCMKCMNQLHTCYSPRRVLYPIKRAGERGAENAEWERITWDEALDLAGTQIADCIEKYGTYAFFTSCGGGGNYSITHSQAVAMAMGTPTFFEPGCAQCWLPRFFISYAMYGEDDNSVADCCVLEPFKGLAKVNAQNRGWDVDPGWDVDYDAQAMVLWGTQPSVSQTAQSGRAMAELRELGVQTVVIDPNMTPDAAKATVWLRVRPGSDTAMVMAWFRYILENKLYDEEFSKYWTNIPFLINPETHLPWLATEVWDDYEPTTPDNTPVYVCVDEDTGELAPLPFGYPEDIKKIVNPTVCATAKVNGKKSRTGGQIYWEAAEPFTLEKAEEICWVPADLIEKAIHIYADPEVAGICLGVATDQQQNSSQMCVGTMGLDMLMGYVNKPGATLTKNYYGQGGNEINPQPAEGEKPDRPTQMFYGLYGSFNSFSGVGFEVGATEADNEARIAALPEGTYPGGRGYMYQMNQLILDRLGTRDYKGLNNWAAAHIPSVLEAIKTGIPYKPRVWYDLSGNKLAVIGNAESWYEAFDEIDFCICQYPNLTSFQMEVGDLVFPVEEWLEYADSSIMPQLNYHFGYFPIIHLGETVASNVCVNKIINSASRMLNERIAAGSDVILGFVGMEMGEAPAEPSTCVNSEDGALQTTANSTYIHECDQSQFDLSFPLGVGIFCGCEEDSVHIDSLVERWGAPSWEELRANPEDYIEPFYIPLDEFWTYDNHLVECTDGLPYGFPTESRKCEVYVTILVKMAESCWPIAYPRPQVACNENIGAEIAEINPDYEYQGMYSPICQYIEPAETALESAPGYDEEYPFTITSGRLPYFHHGTMRHAPFARELYPAPDLYINPTTAAKYGIEHMDWVKITSKRGSTQGRARLNPAMHENVLWMERFWNPEAFDSSQEKKDGGWRQMNIAMMTKNTPPYNEVFGSYTNRGFCVKIEKGEKPDNVWTEPKEFEPFMPDTPSELFPDIGKVIDQPQTDRIVFDDWDRETGTGIY